MASLLSRHLSASPFPSWWPLNLEKVWDIILIEKVTRFWKFLSILFRLNELIVWDVVLIGLSQAFWASIFAIGCPSSY